MTLDSAGRLEPGTRVADRYRVERALAAGGLGVVHVAWDEKLDQRVALKVAGGVGAMKAFRARFRREAVIGARLGRETGFVRAFDWGELGDGLRLYLAMDLVDGAQPVDLASGSLQERVARVRQVAQIVARAHAQGVVHRDLKPGNVLQDPQGRLHLADFGLGKVVGEGAPEVTDDEATSDELTRTGVGMGTPTYMPPEQFEDAKRADVRADVYALGVMLFQALTGGRLPFASGGGPFSVLAAQQKVLMGSAPAPRARDEDPSLPPELDRVCSAALALDPEQRLPSASALVAALDGAELPALDPAAPTLLETGPPPPTHAAPTSDPTPPVDPSADTRPDPAPTPSAPPSLGEEGLPSWKMGLGLLVALPLFGMLLVAVLVVFDPFEEVPTKEGARRHPTERRSGSRTKTTPDGETPDGETPDGETPDGETPDGDTPAGEPVHPVYHDAFEGPELGPGWEVIRPDRTHLAVVNGRLVIVTQYSAEWTTLGDGGEGEVLRSMGGLRNVVRQHAAVGAGDYALEATVTFKADARGHTAGLVLHADDQNYVSLTYSGWEWGNNTSWGFEFTKCVAGTISNEVRLMGTQEMPEDETWRLKLEVEDGVTYRAYAGQDFGKGFEWLEVASVTIPALSGATLHAGLLAVNGRPGVVETDAVFTDLTLTAE